MSATPATLERLDTFQRAADAGELESTLADLRHTVTGMLDALIHLTTCSKSADACEGDENTHHVDADDALWWRDGSKPGQVYPTPGVPAMLDDLENLIARVTG